MNSPEARIGDQQIPALGCPSLRAPSHLSDLGSLTKNKTIKLTVIPKIREKDERLRRIQTVEETG
jgi:hypothetical protein